jgi:hypothetical protein
MGSSLCELIWSCPLQSSNASRDKVEKLRVVGAPLIFVIALNVLREIHHRLRELAVRVFLAAQCALLMKNFEVWLHDDKVALGGSWLHADARKPATGIQSAAGLVRTNTGPLGLSLDSQSRMNAKLRLSAA